MSDEARGGYVLVEASGGTPLTVLVATGGETAVALEARAILERDGIGTRVVSVPRPDRFLAQDQAYRDAVLAPHTAVRVSVEAGSALGWYAMAGGAGPTASLDRFGRSGSYRSLYQQCGLTAHRVATAARACLARAHRARNQGLS
ncbi:transketolase C-terminal domain-containing protein [Streptomyces sp. NPDC006487]|uniref:transketolase-like TK C-terminal-containing protein n=1 Tax=Streptomyces sp. NPDC006487 TaxID=3364748 RepID=UPI0036BFB1AE